MERGESRGVAQREIVGGPSHVIRKMRTVQGRGKLFVTWKVPRGIRRERDCLYNEREKRSLERRKMS